MGVLDYPFNHVSEGLWYSTAIFCLYFGFAVNPPATMGRFVWVCQKDRALQREIPSWFGWLFFSDWWSKKITQLNTKDYQGVISRFHVWMHAGVSWDAAYQPSESWTTDIFNWQKNISRNNRIFQWLLQLDDYISYLPPIIREPGNSINIFPIVQP